MNRLFSEITEVQTVGNISLVKLTCNGYPFSTIVIDTPTTTPYLIAGNKVELLFKENELIISNNFVNDISIENIFPCTIVKIKRGELFCELNLKFGMFDIMALLTVAESKRVLLKVGMEVFTMIKTNEISILQHD